VIHPRSSPTPSRTSPATLKVEKDRGNYPSVGVQLAHMQTPTVTLALMLLLSGPYTLTAQNNLSTAQIMKEAAPLL